MNITLLEVSVFIIALAFLFLVIYLVRAVKTIQKSAEQLNQGLIQMQEEMKVISLETTELLRNTNKLTLDLQEKSKSLDSIFRSIDDVGGAVQQVTESAKQVSSTISNTLQKSAESVTSQRNKLDEVLKYLSLGLSIWEKIKIKLEERENGRRK